MKAIILSAGQGKRLLPLTAETPKCALPILGQSIVEWQIDELASAGIDHITIVVGYGADKVEHLLAKRYGTDRIKFLYNHDFAITDNLVSCWMAGCEMTGDFILLNGDTLFETAVVQRLINGPARHVTVTIDHKAHYDDDDMKVTLDGERLLDIGKDLESDNTHGESIGMILFRGEGPEVFRAALDSAVQNSSAHKKWYLSVIREMCRVMPVHTCSISGLNWSEVDFHVDLKRAENVVRAILSKKEQLEGISAINY